MKNFKLTRRVGAVILGLILVGGGIAFAAQYLARAEYGVRLISMSSAPDNCTSDRNCIYADSKRNLHYTGSWTLNRTAVADAAKSVADGEYLIAYTSLSATRNVTLPLASTGAGRIVYIADESGSASGSVKLRAIRSGSDTVNGSTSAVDVVALAYGIAACTSDGSTKWRCLAASSGGGGVSDLQGAYDGSASGQINQSNAVGGLILRGNSNNDAPLTIKNSAGAAKAHFDQDGSLEVSQFLYSTGTGSDSLSFEAATSNAGSNNAFQFNNTTSLNGSTTLATFGSNGVVKASIYNDGSYIGPKAGTSSSALHAFPSGTGDLVSTDAAQTLSGPKTISGPILSGTVTGTYTLGGTPTLTGERFSSSGTVTIAASGVQDVYSITPLGGANNLALFCDYGWYYSSGGDKMGGVGLAVTYRKVAGTWTKVGSDGVNTGYTSNSYGLNAHGPGATAEAAGNIKVQLTMGTADSTTVVASCREMWF